MHTLDFAKLYVAWLLTFLLITEFQQLRRIIFIQSACVPIICIVSILKGRNHPRLEGVLGGIYSNSNDLAFAIVLSLPFCIAFFLQTKSAVKKVFWIGGMLAMLTALFLTASRAGFITLVISGTVCLWHFGVRGKRLYLIVGTVFVAGLLLVTVGGKLMDRFQALSGDTSSDQSAYGSYLARKYLMEKAVEAIKHYPILGVGVHDFGAYSETWQPVHMSYLQIGAEGGIPVLILYILFFWQGFKNLRTLRKMKDLNAEMVIMIGALHSSLIGFLVGANFAPEAYQFFPYFGVVYTSTLLAIVREANAALPEAPKGVLRSWHESSRNTTAVVPKYRSAAEAIDKVCLN
jgi:O-antigen ligase